MLRFHCRAIRYERNNWSFVGDRWISLKSNRADRRQCLDHQR